MNFVTRQQRPAHLAAVERTVYLKYLSNLKFGSGDELTFCFLNESCNIMQTNTNTSNNNAFLPSDKFKPYIKQYVRNDASIDILYTLTQNTITLLVNILAALHLVNTVPLR